MIDSLRRALSALLRKDGYLLEQDVNERSITHKLAEYLQGIYPDWNVDCEYNRNLMGPKRIAINPRAFLDLMAERLDLLSYDNEASSISNVLLKEHVTQEDIIYLRDQLRASDNLIYDEELELAIFILRSRNGKLIAKTIYPDIIVHVRGRKNNLMVIEAKKSSNNVKESRLYDLIKLIALTESPEYGYKVGFFVNVPTGTDYSPRKVFKFSRVRLYRKVYRVE